MISQAELISKSYHYLVPGIISKFLEKVWVPLTEEIAVGCLLLTSPVGFCRLVYLIRKIGPQKIDFILMKVTSSQLYIPFPKYKTK